MFMRCMKLEGLHGWVGGVEFDGVPPSRAASEARSEVK